MKREEWPEWRDFLGEAIVVGDTVIYACMESEAACLGFGQVTRINKLDSKGLPIYTYGQGAGRRVAPSLIANWVKRNDPVVPSAWVEGATISVQPLERAQGHIKARALTLDTWKVVKITNTYVQKFEALETELVDAELTRIREKHGATNDQT